MILTDLKTLKSKFILQYIFFKKVLTFSRTFDIIKSSKRGTQNKKERIRK